MKIEYIAQEAISEIPRRLGPSAQPDWDGKFCYMLETPSIFKYSPARAVKILKCGQSAGNVE